MTNPQSGNWNDPSSGQQPSYQEPSYWASGESAGQAPPAYPTYPAYPAPAVSQPTNSLAIASLVCSLAGVATCISAPVGAILGHIARRQIRERGEAGDGMALAGIIVGWIITGVMVLICAFYVVVIVAAIATESTALGPY